MNKYIYKNPNGKRASLSRKQHNNLLPTRRLSFIKSLVYKYDYYVDETGITIEGLVSTFGKVFITMLMPIYILIGGIPQTLKETKRIWLQKKYGAFIREHIHTSSVKYTQFLKLVNMEHLNK